MVKDMKSLMDFSLSENGEERGTGYMIRNVCEKILSDTKNLNNFNWIVMPNNNDFSLAQRSKNIIWCHLPSYDIPEDLSIFLWDISVRNNTKAYVVQSQWHKEDLVENFDLDPEKVFVLNNAITPLNNYKKSKDKIRMIYASQVERGLDLLLESMSLVKDQNIELTVHSCGCDECVFGINAIINRYGEKRIRYVGFTNKETYYKNLEESHIMPYPCTFEETGCISVMEAMSSGNKIITTNLGVLPELTKNFATIIHKVARYDHPFEGKKRKRFVKNFAKEINKEIKNIKNDRFDPSEQVSYVNKFYGWETVKNQWLEFDNKLANV
jgi:glycosyltransferase involved in cell wall biosynthesis